MVVPNGWAFGEVHGGRPFLCVSIVQKKYRAIASGFVCRLFVERLAV